ncbi:hypothetical protein HDU89_001711 [Geranomyces variabilis]|nr:hypothetical protein HDU89_001711 [Geranomyces variabilis]
MSEIENTTAAPVPEQEDPVVQAVVEKTKSKKPRSEKQIEAMRRAQEKRTANLIAMKELKAKAEALEAKESKSKEKELEKEKAKKVIEVYEKEKQRIKEEKAAACLARKPKNTPPAKIKVPVPVDVSSEDDKEEDQPVLPKQGHVLVEFDDPEEDPWVTAIFGKR